MLKITLHSRGCNQNPLFFHCLIRQAGVPVVKKGQIMIDSPADTYLDFSNWGKGVVWVNGHHLGRYWAIRPQQTVYISDEWLKKGKNQILVFELLKPEQTLLKGLDKPVLNTLK